MRPPILSGSREAPTTAIERGRNSARSVSGSASIDGDCGGAGGAGGDCMGRDD